MNVKSWGMSLIVPAVVVSLLWWSQEFIYIFCCGSAVSFSPPRLIPIIDICFKLKRKKLHYSIQIHFVSLYLTKATDRYNAKN